MLRNARKSCHKLAVVAAVAAITMAGCGGSDSEGDKPDSAALGTVNKASGDPVLVYFIGEGKGEVIDNTDETKAVSAVVEYANEYLGGLNGRPIELKECETKGTPAGTTDCANQAVSDKAVAVVNGTAGQVDAEIDVLTKAKIPLVAEAATTQKALSTPGVFSLTNGLAFLGTPGTFAKQKGYKSATMVAIDVPAALEPAKQIGALAFGNNGVKLDVIGIAPGTADMIPQITAANKAKPELYHVIGDEAFCTSALKAIRTVAPDADVTIIDRCINPEAGASIPGGYEGMNVVTVLNASTSTPDGKLFAAVVDAYGDGAQASTEAAAGYSGMLGFIRAMNSAKVSDYTAAGVASAMKAAGKVDFPLGDGVQFQCDGKQIVLAPNTCTSSALIGTADKDGKVAKFETVEAGTTYNPPPA